MEETMLLAALINLAGAGINLATAILNLRKRKSPNPPQSEKDSQPTRD
jgi:hypothetical protein